MRTFAVVVQPTNNPSEVEFPGSIIDFDTIPIQFVPPKSLETWLASRGVAVDNNLLQD